jgi:hypothetical protein
MTQLARHVGRRPAPAIERVQSTYNVINIRTRIAHETELTLEEISMLEKWFERALLSSPKSKGRRLETHTFVKMIFAAYVSPFVCQHLEKSLGTWTDFYQCCTLVSQCSRGSKEAKLRFLFARFSSGGILSRETAAHLATAALPLKRKGSPEQPQDMDTSVDVGTHGTTTIEVWRSREHCIWNSNSGCL